MKIRIDGVTFEVECKDASFEQVWSKAEAARADDAKRHETELAKVRSDAAEAASKSKSDFDKEKARADQAEVALKAKTDELQKAPDEIRKEIANRMKLNSLASEILGSTVKVDEMDADAVMKAVILSTDPEANLDEASPAYIAARFDAAVAYAGRSALERGSGPRVTRGDAAMPDDEDDGEESEEEKNFKKASKEASTPKPKSKRK